MATHPLLYLLKLLKGRTLPGAWIRSEILKKKNTKGNPIHSGLPWFTGKTEIYLCL